MESQHIRDKLKRIENWTNMKKSDAGQIFEVCIM